MNNNCSTDPCGGAPLDAHCVKFTTQELACIGATINDRVDDILVKIDEKLCDLTGVNDDHIIDVVCDALEDTLTIDMSCVDGTIQSNLIVGLGDQTLEDIMFWTGTEVKTRDLPSIIQDIQDVIGNSFNDTNTVDFTYDTLSKIVVADVRISNSVPGNAIQAFSDGLWSPLTVQNGLVYGGQVTWTGVGYIYDIAAAGYYINFAFYESPAIQVTLDPSDTVFNRIDTFIVDINGVASAVTGIPSIIPSEPPLDLGDELRLSAALVQVNSIEPLQDQCIYEEGIEWTITESATFDGASVSNPCFGTVSIEATNPQTDDFVLLTEPTVTAFAPNVYGTLTFLLTSKGGWSDGFVTLQWENFFSPVGNPVIIAAASYGFNDTDTVSCQSINIPINDFGLTGGDMADSIRISATTGIADFGFYIDNVCLSTQQLGSSSINLYTFQSGLKQLPNTNIVEFGGNPLLHNTTLDTKNYVQTFIGNPSGKFPYEFVYQQVGGKNIGITSFRHGDPTYGSQNVKFGVSYTDRLYTEDSINYTGALGDSTGFILGTNLDGRGDVNLVSGDVDFVPGNTNSKFTGIFLHTLDIDKTDGVDIFATPESAIVAGKIPNSVLEVSKVATFHVDKNITFQGYPDTRNDGLSTTNRFLSTDVDGNIGMYGTVTPFPISSYLVDGGEIAWIANYDYNVSAANYVILGIPYSSPETPVTLDIADGTFDRIDLVVVDTDGTVQVITGDPSANPQNPSYDPSTQLPLSFILVAAGSASPICNALAPIYQENLGTPSEWAAVSSSGTIVVNSVTNPRTGTKDIQATAAALGATITFTPLSPFDTTNFTQLDIYIRSKGTWGSASAGRTINIRFYTASGAVGQIASIHPSGGWGFDSSITTGYQQVAIPKSIFNLADGLLITSMVFTIGGNSGTMGFYMDDIQIEKNCNIVAGAVVTADNGLRMSTATNVQLGGPVGTPSSLLHDSYITSNGFSLVMSGSNLAFPTLVVSNFEGTNSGSNGINASANAGNAVWGNSNTGGRGILGSTVNGTGVQGESSGFGAAGVFLTSGGGIPLWAVKGAGTTSTAENILILSKTIGGTPAAGYGGIIAFTLKDDGNFNSSSTQIVSKWTDAVHATYTSQLDIYGANTGTPNVNPILSAHGSGVVGIGISSSFNSTRLHIVDNTLSTSMVRLESTANTSNTLLQGVASGTNTSGASFLVVNGAGVIGQASGSGTGVAGSSTSGTGVQASSGNLSLYATGFSSSTNAVKEIVRIASTSTGTPAVGLGASIDFYIEADGGSSAGSISNRIITKWVTSAAEASRISQFSITGVNGGAPSTYMSFEGTGSATLYDSSYVFPALIFGSNTSSFPMIKRIGIQLAARLGDDSGPAAYSADTVYTDFLTHATGGNLTIRAGTGDLIFQTFQTSSFVETGRFTNNGAFQLKPITATAASAITPGEGMIVFVSNTNGTFISIGIWCYQNGAWKAL